MTWLFPEEATTATTALLERLAADTGVVPAWWYIEIVNVIAHAEHKGRIRSAQTALFLADLARLQIEVDTQPPDSAFTDLLPLCRQHRLTSYDAVYLELAVRRQLPLATLDLPLRKAAKTLNVELL
jgi:predicted nucleic acid-binding protein